MHKRFDRRDFRIIGIHTPEFEREKKISNVREAVKQHGLTYPQFIDNDYAYWRALQNRYWPAFYVIDKKGMIRHVAIGEVHLNDRRDRELRALVEKLLAEP